MMQLYLIMKNFDKPVTSSSRTFESIIKGIKIIESWKDLWKDMLVACLRMKLQKL